MSLQEKINQQLEQLSSSNPSFEQPSTMRIDTARGRLQCELTAVDKLACSFLLLSLQTDVLANASVDTLKKFGEDLSARLNYLLEPIDAIELDAEGVTLQMRSNPPQRDDNGQRYYELVVRRGGEISLRRYQRSKSESTRQPIAAHITREVLGRLATDFESMLS